MFFFDKIDNTSMIVSDSKKILKGEYVKYLCGISKTRQDKFYFTKGP